MSGQCLSASGAGRALTPATDLRLGGPLPPQLANLIWAPPGAPELWSCDIVEYYPSVRMAMLNPGVGTHTLLPLSPLPPLLGFVRLACLIHAANVRSEPGSNPSQCVSNTPFGVIINKKQFGPLKNQTQIHCVRLVGFPANRFRLK